MQKKRRLFFFIVPVIFSCLLSHTLSAQTGSDTTPPEVSWPHRLTLGLGAGLNLNFASGLYNAPDSNNYNKGFGAAPTFFALLEIPLAENWMLVPRIHYS